MKISTKGRYALRMMLEFAMNPDTCTTINQVAKNQQISEKYLEQIVTILSRAGYVKSMRGSHGGYRLAKTPGEYTIGMILRLVEGSLAPVSCLEDEINHCDRAHNCAALHVWEQLNDAISQVVDHTTLTDLVKEQRSLQHKDLKKQNDTGLEKI